MAGNQFVVVLEQEQIDAISALVDDAETLQDMGDALTALLDAISGDKRVYQTPPKRATS